MRSRLVISCTADLLLPPITLVYHTVSTKNRYFNTVYVMNFTLVPTHDTSTALAR